MRMHTLALLSLVGFLGCCAHDVSTYVPAFGFAGRQCVIQRPVICIIDKDMSKEWCENHVVHAIANVNKAVDLPMLVFAGSYSGETQLDEVKKLVNVGYLVIKADKLPGLEGEDPNQRAQTLGVTINGSKTAGGPYPGRGDCITFTYIALDLSVVNGDRSQFADSVIEHEMFHALGAQHSNQSMFESIMRPAISMPNASAHASPWDIAALRAAYHR